MADFRFIVQGDGVRSDGEWFGFYAARQVQALSEEEAKRDALGLLEAEWKQGASVDLGTLTNVRVVCGWRSSPLQWRKLPNAGNTLFNDSLEAQRSAFRVEARAASAPARVIRAVMQELV